MCSGQPAKTLRHHPYITYHSHNWNSTTNSYLVRQNRCSFNDFTCSEKSLSAISRFVGITSNPYHRISEGVTFHIYSSLKRSAHTCAYPYQNRCNFNDFACSEKSLSAISGFGGIMSSSYHRISEGDDIPYLFVTQTVSAYLCLPVPKPVQF